MSEDCFFNYFLSAMRDTQREGRKGWPSVRIQNWDEEQHENWSREATPRQVNDSYERAQRGKGQNAPSLRDGRQSDFARQVLKVAHPQFDGREN